MSFKDLFQCHKSIFPLMVLYFMHHFLSHNDVFYNPLSLNKSTLVQRYEITHNFPQSYCQNFMHNLVDKITKANWSKVPLEVSNLWHKHHERTIYGSHNRVKPNALLNKLHGSNPNHFSIIPKKYTRKTIRL